MRCGFDRLAERVKTVIGENLQSGHLFVFRSRRGDRLKILVWDRDGFVLWYKRLEAEVFKLLRVEQGARSVGTLQAASRATPLRCCADRLVWRRVDAGTSGCAWSATRRVCRVPAPLTQTAQRCKPCRFMTCFKEMVRSSPLRVRSRAPSARYKSSISSRCSRMASRT
jgi:IS66 Orf2 like protein